MRDRVCVCVCARALRILLIRLFILALLTIHRMMTGHRFDLISHYQQVTHVMDHNKVSQASEWAHLHPICLYLNVLAALLMLKHLNIYWMVLTLFEDTGNAKRMITHLFSSSCALCSMLISKW